MLLGNTDNLALPGTGLKTPRTLTRRANHIPVNLIVRQFHLVPSRLVLAFERLHLFNATTVAGCVAEVGDEESLD